MVRLHVERRMAPLWFRPLIPLVAIVITFVLTSVLILAAKANPLEAFYYFLIYPLSSQFSAIEVLVKATPLLLTGAAVTFAFAAGYWNIGAEGQLLAGAIAAAWDRHAGQGRPTGCRHPADDRRRFYRRDAVGADPGAAEDKAGGG